MILQKKKNEAGIKVPNLWQLASKRVNKKESSDKPIDPQPQKSDNGIQPLDANELAVNEILLKAGTGNAATFYNLLKAKGFKIIAPVQDLKQDEEIVSDKKECVSASSNVQVLRAKEAMSFRGKFNFKESKQDETGIGYTRFRCVLIQEGMGNFGDAYYYTREALKSAVPVFEGKKIYADHPDKLSEEIRPERSVKDVLGHFENVAIEESEDGRAQLVADVVVLPDEPYRWARALMRHSVEYAKKYPDKDFIGLSINASGDSQKMPIDEFVKESNIPSSAMNKIKQAMEKGIDEIRLVTTIREAISCDLVTEAGAGGKVINLIEGAKKMENEMNKEMDKELDKKEAEPVAKHDDEQQDVELIKKMIAQHLKGDGEEEPNEEEVQHAMEAYEFDKDEKDSKKRIEKAVHAMKCAKHLAEKKSMEAKEEMPKDDEKKEACKEDEAKKESEEKKESENKESMKNVLAENAKLKGELAALKENAKKADLAKYIDDKLAASKLPRAVTKNFMESFKDYIKSTQDFDKMFEGFAKSFKNEGSEAIREHGFAIMTERKVNVETKSKALNGFGDCLK